MNTTTSQNVTPTEGAARSWLGRLVRSLREEPEAWTFGAHTADHRSGLRIWTANMPVLNISIYRPFEQGIPLLWKWRIYRAISYAKGQEVARMVSANGAYQPADRAGT